MPFRYARPDGADDAIAAVRSSPHGRFLAGGTNLVDLMRLGVETPDLLVDVAGATSCDVEDTPDGGLRIGAGVRNADLAADARVADRYPALAQALLQGASGQIRNIATVGGNLLQRTRCSYFQDITKPCNKREPGTGCPARDGEHRNLAVIGHSPDCVATHPSDMAVALAAFDATVITAGASAERHIPLVDFHRLPGDEPERDTVLEPGELIVAVELPPLPVAARSSYLKARERASFAFALASVATAVAVIDGVVDDVRIAFGGVAHRPWRAFAAESALRGAPATEASFHTAAEDALRHAQPLRDNAYKVTLARRMLVRALTELAA